MNLLTNQKAAESVDSVYINLEASIMQNIARHLQTWKQPIDTDRWLLQRLAEIGQLNRENIKLISKSAGLSQTAAERMLNDMAEEAIKNIDPGLKKLAKEGLAGKMTSPKKSRNVRQTVSAMQKQAKDTLNMCNTTMLYKARDAYSGLVQKIAKEAKEYENKQEYLNTLNKYGEAVTTGVESRQQAVRKCLREFNDKGIPAFVDKAGREWTPEAYVNMAMRNTARQTADEVQSARCRDAGVNLIQIDSHSGARPKCAKDQGKIFSLDNKNGTTEDVSGRKIKFYAWSSSSYGDKDGILGINCGHHKWPFVPGVNVQRYFPTDDLDANDELYKQTQVQRALERDIRKQKRECMLYDEAGDSEGFERAAVRLKQKEADLKHYVKGHTDLHRRTDREQVVGFDERISAEAVGKSQQHYKKWAKSIGAETGPKTLAGYYNLKYNDSRESRLYNGYVRAVNQGNISPLVNYDKFKEVYAEAERKLVGRTTSDGQEIKGITVHLAERIIGQHAEGDEPKKGMRMGVSIDNVTDALLSGNAGKAEIRQDGRKGQKFYNNSCCVSFNPETKMVIQVSPGGKQK